MPRRPSPLRERSSCTSEAASDAGSGWASDRGSVFSERVEKVAAVAAEAMVTPGFKMTLFGLACLLMPALVLLLAPLMVLLMPLLLPLGFTLLVLGLGRAAVGMSFAHRAAHRAPPRDARWRLGGGGARRPSELNEATGGTGLSPLIAQGSMRELGGVTAQRGEQLVRQTVSLLRSNVARATLDLSDELQGQLQAMQQELHLWVGANSNLKPYSNGQIGWLIRGGDERSRSEHDDLDHTAR